MLRIFIILFFFFGSVCKPSEPVPVWSQSGEAEGISTYYRKIPGSPVYALKGTGKINAPLWKVASVLLDSKRGIEWIDSLEETKMLKKINSLAYIEYNHIRTPLILKDRDFVTEIQLEINQEKKSFTMTYRPAPLENQIETKFIRGEIVFGRLTITSLEPGKTSHIEGELHCDPKGAIPKWIVNLFQKGWPRKTLEGVRKQAAKSDISIPEEFKEVLESTVKF